MVGTAQAADFGIFMRKVGYSVGLENLFLRAVEYGRRYAAAGSFRASDWNRLVRKDWGLQNDHVADVFAAFDIQRMAHGEPIAGTAGECLGILATLTTAPRYMEAARFLVTHSIVMHDGDIFLNALAAGFEADRFVPVLLDLIRTKREFLYRVLTSHHEKEAVHHAIAIDRQRTNRGSAGGKSLDAAIRRASLSDARKGFGLPQPVDLNSVEEPSSDYIHKVLVTRRGWAESLGLFDLTGITEAGMRLLMALRTRELSSGGGALLIWPTRFEVQKARFDLRSFDVLGLKETQETYSIVYEAMRPNGALIPFLSTDEELSAYVRDVYSRFRSLSPNRSMIRNELPLGVLVGTMYAQAVAEQLEPRAGPIEASDSRLSNHNIVVRRSQSIELAITVKRRESLPSL